MKIYVSKRNENVTAKIIKEDEKFKTVVIEYLTGDKAGQNNSITTSTLKRWWKVTEIPDEVVEESTVESKEPINSSETLVPMPGIEKLSDLKKEYTNIKQREKSKPKNVKKDNTKQISEIENMLRNTFDVKTYDTMKNYFVLRKKNEKKKHLQKLDVEEEFR